MNVILVEDEKPNRENLEYLVGKVLPGASWASFGKASAALEYIESHPVDIALLDIHMRGIDGITIARALREKYPRANILFCTGFTEYSLEAWDLNCSGYLLKPITEEKLRNALANLRYPVVEEKRVAFHCFGNFEAYCDGSPILFKYGRTKELLAYLVDRNGASCSLRELAAILFEDEQHRSYLYQIRLDLINTLSGLGVEDILIQSRGYLGIARDKVKCDYFDYLDHKIEAPVQEYMTQYSFGEQTCAMLFRKDY
ncbi:MAG: LytR/AlgR family response regulator transcription factor [Faecalibacterium sp.]